MQPITRDVVVFPASLHVAENSVNEFIKTAMNVCTSGDYEAFRSLWSAREKPLERAEFDQAWSAVQEVRVLAVEPVALIGADAKEGAVPEAMYGIAAHLRLNPERLSAQTKAERNVVLLLVREHEQWRLAPAPKPLRRWLKEKAGIENDET